MVRGAYVVVAVIGASIAIMSAFFLLGEGLREEYHVPSRGDRERYDLDLTDQRVVWLEAGGKVLWAPLGPTKRLPFTLEPRNASLEDPVLAEGRWVAWVERGADEEGRWSVVRVHDLETNRSYTLPAEGRGLLDLPGRTLSGDRLLVRAHTVFDTEDLFLVTLPPTDEPAQRLHLQRSEDPAVLTRALLRDHFVLSGNRVVWAEGRLVHVTELPSGTTRDFTANGTVVNLTADGDLVAWAEQHGNFRRVVVANLTDGSQREASPFAADQYQPALNGTRLLFVQRDGLVRLVDLVSGAERVLPARNQENVHLRLGTSWAAWLSGTIEGHNVFTVPV